MMLFLAEEVYDNKFGYQAIYTQNLAIKSTKHTGSYYLFFTIFYIIWLSYKDQKKSN